MISPEFLKNYATEKQTSLKNVVREYAQLTFLSFFYQHDAAGDFYFKGGTALRLVHNSPRFSEDLDFSAPNLLDCASYENVLEKALFLLEKEGFQVKIVDSINTTGGCRSEFNLKGEGGLETSLSLDVSLRRKNKFSGEVVLVDSELYTPFTVMVLQDRLLVQEKLEALFSRQNPRDFFDIYFILRKRMEQQIVAERKDAILKLLENVDDSFFQGLEVFLPLSQKHLVRDFKDVLIRELRRF